MTSKENVLTEGLVKKCNNLRYINNQLQPKHVVEKIVN